ncbi:hypothetical protein MKQ70_00585 [Chitinophaga sedimenti]|nr:hypothetical protein [Chitinophaga sedimenti]MCK7553579.1 hypothetical protein [Chitinophaga sedimenti]
MYKSYCMTCHGPERQGEVIILRSST